MKSRCLGSFVVLLLALSLTIAAGNAQDNCPCDTQSEQSQKIAASSEKLINRDDIMRGFEQGDETVKVIVNLVEPGERTTTDWKSKHSLKLLQGKVAASQETILSSLTKSEFRLRYRLQNQTSFSGEVTLKGLEKLKKNPHVVSIEPVYVLEPHLRQGIPLMQADTYRSTYNGQGTAVAIVDTGVDYRHPMLGNGGFPNSKVIGGYDFGDYDSDPMPYSTQAHGTCCAGIAAGDIGNTGDYIGGVAYNAKLYALKITSGSSGSASSDTIASAWDWCITHKNDDPANPIVAISTSFGGGRYYSSCDGSESALATAANNAVAAGITLTVSSGNDGYCNSIASPSCLSNVISIGAVYDASIGTYYPCVSSQSCVTKYSGGCSTGYYAIDNTYADRVTSYSNTASFLTLLAPSNDCYTTDIIGSGGYSSGDYLSDFGGTSAACPYAAGAIACLQSAAKSCTGSFLTPAQVKAALTSTGNNVTDPKVAITKPRINLSLAIESVCGTEPPPVPDSISYPTSNATGQYTVSWAASSGATSYQLERSDNGGSTWSQVYSGSGTSYSESVSNGSYRYRVKATNSSGSSDWRTGDWDCVVYILPPPAPGLISYPTNSATGQYTVSWSASSGATSYQLEWSDDSGNNWFEVYSGSGTSYSESVGNGSYRYRVKATNSSGSSDWKTGDWDCVVYIPPVYCSASGSTCDEYISGVVVGAINNTGTGCSHYADYTAISTTVNIGQGYVVTVINGHSYSVDQCGIWVDWNQDYSFDDAGETISVSGTPGRGPYTAVITAPDDVVLGNTRMRIRITYTGGVSPCGSATYGEVEDYTINVSERICLIQRLDGFETGNFSVLPWITSGNANWTVTSADKNSGIYSAKAGTIAHNQSTSLEFTFDVETGNITFYRKVSSESNCDWLRFYINGVQQAEWSGEQGWAQFTYPILAGTRTFKWTYSKDYSVSSGSDTAWIDDITFPITIPCSIGDFDHDGDVDTDDLGVFCEGWLTDDTVTDIAPPDGDGIVDMMDFAVFAQHWLEETSP